MLCSYVGVKALNFCLHIHSKHFTPKAPPHCHLLIYLDLQQIGWGPWTLRRATSLPNLLLEPNIHFFQKQPHRHTQNTVWPNLWVACGFDKGIYKITHHNSLGSDQTCPYTVILRHFSGWEFGVLIMVFLSTHVGLSEQGSPIGAEKWTKAGNTWGPCGTASRADFMVVRALRTRADGGFMNLKKLSKDQITLLPGTGKRGDPTEKAEWSKSQIRALRWRNEWHNRKQTAHACWEAQHAGNQREPGRYTGHLRNSKEELRLPVNNSRKLHHWARDSLDKDLLEKTVCFFNSIRSYEWLLQVVTMKL